MILLLPITGDPVCWDLWQHISLLRQPGEGKERRKTLSSENVRRLQRFQAQAQRQKIPPTGLLHFLQSSYCFHLGWKPSRACSCCLMGFFPCWLAVWANNHKKKKNLGGDESNISFLKTLSKVRVGLVVQAKVLYYFFLILKQCKYLRKFTLVCHRIFQDFSLRNIYEKYSCTCFVSAHEVFEQSSCCIYWKVSWEQETAGCSRTCSLRMGGNVKMPLFSY